MYTGSHKVNSFKGILHTKSPYALTFFDKYPDSPSALPQDVFNAAYDTTDPPIHRHVHRYETLARHVPLRKSSKLLRPVVSQPFAETDPQQMMATMLNMVRAGRLPIGATDTNIPITYLQHGDYTRNGSGRGAATWDDTWHERRSTPALCAAPAESLDASSPRCTFPDSASASAAALQFKPVPRHSAILDGAVGGTAEPSPVVTAESLHAERACAAALPGETTTVKFGDGNAHAPTQVRATSEDIEDEAFNRLRAKADKRKLDKQEAVKKRPVAAVTMTPPPAGKVIKLDVAMKWDNKCTVNQNTFSCRYYGRAKTQLNAMGANPDDKKATLTHVSKLASDLWQKHNK